MSAKNAVIAGDYEKKKVVNTAKGIYIVLGFTKMVEVNKETVESWDELDSSVKTSGVSAVSRGLAGSLILGPAGLLVGLTAKKKGTHIVAVQFKDGKKSLLEVDEKIHKALITTLF